MVPHIILCTVTIGVEQWLALILIIPHTLSIHGRLLVDKLLPAPLDLTHTQLSLTQMEQRKSPVVIPIQLRQRLVVDSSTHSRDIFKCREQNEVVPLNKLTTISNYFFYIIVLSIEWFMSHLFQKKVFWLVLPREIFVKKLSSLTNRMRNYPHAQTVPVVVNGETVNIDLTLVVSDVCQIITLNQTQSTNILMIIRKWAF